MNNRAKIANDFDVCHTFFIFFGDERTSKFDDNAPHHDGQESDLHEYAYKTQDSIVCVV